MITSFVEIIWKTDIKMQKKFETYFYAWEKNLVKHFFYDVKKKRKKKQLQIIHRLKKVFFYLPK